MSSEHAIHIAPQLRRVVTPIDLIQSAGSLTFEGRGKDVHAHPGQLFDIRSDAYRLTLLIRDGQLVIERNEAAAAILLPDTEAMVRNYPGWSPTELSVFAAAPTETGPLTAEEIDAMTVRVLSEPPVFPPAALLPGRDRRR